MALPMRKSRAPGPPNACPLTQCMAVLGGAWTPNVIWYLSGGPRRFTELRADIPGVSAKVLTGRLRSLETKGVVNRRVVPTSPPSVEYALTELGRELVPAIAAIAEVGHRLKSAEAAQREPAQAGERALRREPASAADGPRDASRAAARAAASRPAKAARA